MSPFSGRFLTAHFFRPKQSAFNGRRIVVFSGGAAKDTEGVLNEIREIRDGGGFGSIIGRNSFQRPKAEALELLGTIAQVYQGKA